MKSIDKELTYYVSLTEYNEVKRMFLKANYEINTLKELLKRAETQIIAYKNNDTLPERAFYEKEVEELLGKIDEVLK